MALPRELTPHTRIRVHDWPGTRGKRYTVLDVDEAKGHVRALDRDHRFRVFPISNVEVVKR